jgi:hypothetical protein
VRIPSGIQRAENGDCMYFGEVRFCGSPATILFLSGTFVDAEHTNWDELLPVCEFAYNNSWQRSTGKTPFEMLNGRHPPTPAALLGEVGLPREPADVAVAGHLARLHRAWESARAALKEAAAAQKRQADRKMRPTVIKVGDQVKMETKFVLKARAGGGPKGKFNAVWIGPFKVLEMVSPNVARLELPAGWRMHPVVNVSRLEPFLSSDRFPGRDTMRPEAVHLLVPAEFPFTRVVGYLAGRGRGKTREVLVQWADLPNASWVEAAHMEAECVRAYGSNVKHKEMVEKMRKLNLD